MIYNYYNILLDNILSLQLISIVELYKLKNIFYIHVSYGLWIIPYETLYWPNSQF